MDAKEFAFWMLRLDVQPQNGDIICCERSALFTSKLILFLFSWSYTIVLGSQVLSKMFPHR